MNELEVVRRKLARAEKKTAVLESMIEDKTRELYLSAQKLASKVAYQQALYRIVPNALVVASSDGLIKDVNDSALRLLAYERDQLVDRALTSVWGGAGRVLGDAEDREDIEQSEEVWTTERGGEVPVLLSVAYLDANGDGNVDIVCVATDLRDRKQMEVELRHAHKLESVGQLAAGVAHEINTPMQFIGDNVHFLKDAFSDVIAIVDAYAEVQSTLGSAVTKELREKVEEAEEDADLEYVRERAPKAFGRALDGIARVTEIVAAMKAFSHPSHDKAPCDLNKAIETALTVAKSEYKYIADVETDLGDLPSVVCNIGDMNQVFLNLIVNAAHAIQDTLGEGERGSIRVSSALKDGMAVVSIADSGCGIPEGVREKIFDPFFTTKDVGRGTGQGLSLAHTVVTDRHGGTLTFETEVGQGTTFLVSLPISPATNGVAKGSSAQEAA